MGFLDDLFNDPDLKKKLDEFGQSPASNEPAYRKIIDSKSERRLDPNDLPDELPEDFKEAIEAFLSDMQKMIDSGELDGEVGVSQVNLMSDDAFEALEQLEEKMKNGYEIHALGGSNIPEQRRAMIAKMHQAVPGYYSFAFDTEGGPVPLRDWNRLAEIGPDTIIQQAREGGDLTDIKRYVKYAMLIWLGEYCRMEYSKVAEDDEELDPSAYLRIYQRLIQYHLSDDEETATEFVGNRSVDVHEPASPVHYLHNLPPERLLDLIRGMKVMGEFAQVFTGGKNCMTKGQPAYYLLDSLINTMLLLDVALRHAANMEEYVSMGMPMADRIEEREKAALIRRILENEGLNLS